MSDIAGSLPQISNTLPSSFDVQQVISNLPSAVQQLPTLSSGRGIAGLLQGNADTQIAPIQQRAEQNMTAFRNKYQQMAGYLRTLPPEVRNSLIDFDSKRVAGGNAPLTQEQTLRATQYAVTKQPQTSVAPRSLWDVPGNAVNDLKTIVGSIPKLLDPRTYLNELRQIPHIGEVYDKLRAQGLNPLEAAAQLPGIRMVPGSFLVGNLTNPGELARHPLFTALDLLPVANHFAQMSPTFLAATREAETANVAARATYDATLAKNAEAMAAGKPELLQPEPHMALTPAPRAIPTFLTKMLDADGNVVTRPIAQAIGDSRLGQAAQESFAYRDVWRQLAGRDADLGAVSRGEREARNPIEQYVADIRDLAELHMPNEADRAVFKQKVEVGDYTNLSGNDLELLGKLRDRQERFQQYLHDAYGINFKVDGEWISRQQAEPVINARNRAATAQRISVHRDELINPSGNVDPQSWRDSLSMAANNVDRRLRKHEIDSVLRVGDAYGYDMTAARKAMTRADQLRNHNYTAVIDAANAAFDGGVVNNRVGPIQIIDELKRGSSRPDEQVAVLTRAIADGNTKRITETLNNILNRKNELPALVNNPDLVDSIRSYRDRVTWDNKYGDLYDRKAAERLTRKAERLMDKTVPGRFVPLVQQRTASRTLEMIPTANLSEAEVADLTQAIVESNWKAADRIRGLDDGRYANVDNPPKTTLDLYRGVEREVAQTWRQMRANGADPTFVHKVSRSRGSTVAQPRIGPVPNVISQGLPRFFDMSPGVHDWAVAFTHQGMEVLQRQATQNFIQWVMDNYGRKQADLIDEYAATARNPGALDFNQQLRDTVGQHWEVFNPDKKGYSWGGVTFNKYADQQIWLPKALAKNLDRLIPSASPLRAVFDGTTDTFRTAVVGLSPKTHINNVLGGLLMVVGQTDPTVFKYWRQARDLINSPENIADPALRAGLGSFKREFLDSNLARSHAKLSYDFGSNVNSIYDTFLKARDKAAASGAKEFMGKVIDKSLSLNGVADDQYRAMAYLYGYDKAITKGMSEEGARIAGQELLRKSMMDWTSLTPIERQVYKSIFPFYGFMRHAMQYVANYPIDHPLRAATMASFAQAEQEDNNGLPLNMLGFLPIGSPNSKGGQNFIQIGAINPFNDVANLFTVAGFLRSTNPIMSSAFESVGLTQGSADLYPTLRFDPESGRLDAVRPSFLGSLAENTIPQTRLLSSFLGINADFNRQLQKDPAAAVRSLLSAAGAPMNFRHLNVPQQYFKTEVNRLSTLQSVKNQALLSGDWREAIQYPELRALLDQIQSGQMDVSKFTPPVATDLQQQARQLTGVASNSQYTGGI